MLAMMRNAATVALLLGSSPVAHAQGDTTSYRRSSVGTRILESTSGAQLKILVEGSVLGAKDVEIAEAILPVGLGAGPASHRHGSTNHLRHFGRATTW
jgi:hypothetical protein